MSNITNIISAIIHAIIFLILIRLLVEIVIAYSQTSLTRRNPVIGFLYDFTEPFYKPFQRILPQSNMGLDTSPIFAIAALILLNDIIKVLLNSLQRVIF